MRNAGWLRGAQALYNRETCMKLPLLFAAACSIVCAADPACPAYPSEQRAAHMALRPLERAPRFASHNLKTTAGQPHAAGANFIDDFIFGQMAANGISPAPPASDTEFLRRIMLDLTGRIPAPEQVVAYLNNSDPGKAFALIDSLIGSDAFIDYWTLFYGNLFQVTSEYYYFIGIPGRNQFNRYLRDFIARDRSYQDVVTELITATGDSHASGPPNFLMRGIQYSQPVQDTWDEMTNRVTSLFLGVQSQCISCHDGRGHLGSLAPGQPGINLYLSTRTRKQFWQQSAFFSRMSILEQPVDAFNQQRKGIISDRTSGGYNGVLSDPGNPGPRPLRFGGPYDPVYLFTGETPQSGEWRKELARMVANDRQFARAAVNYLWAQLFRAGIVDPPNGWDLARVDAANPPPDPWTLQPSHPELLEALADEFIASGYSIRHMIRLMAVSRAYALSSRYPGAWRPGYARYFAKSFPRRLSAEEIYDAMAVATGTQIPLFVEGFAPLLWAGQLPDPTEPRGDGAIHQFLQTFGRGDWWKQARDTRSNVIQILYLMNDVEVNFRTWGNKYRNANSRVAQLAASNASDADAVTQLCLATLGRYPTDGELAAAIRDKHLPREEWLSDIQWVFLNETDFLFNH